MCTPLLLFVSVHLPVRLCCGGEASSVGCAYMISLCVSVSLLANKRGIVASRAVRAVLHQLEQKVAQVIATAGGGVFPYFALIAMAKPWSSRFSRCSCNRRWPQPTRRRPVTCTTSVSGITENFFAFCAECPVESPRTDNESVIVLRCLPSQLGAIEERGARRLSTWGTPRSYYIPTYCICVTHGFVMCTPLCA